MRRAEREFEARERRGDRDDGDIRERSMYRNDKKSSERDLERVERRKKRIEEKIPAKPRTASDETPVEPPNFTLAIQSVKPVNAPPLDPISHRIERVMSRLKPVTEKVRKEEQEAEISKRAEKAATEAQIDAVTNCWGCGVEFQTEEPSKIGYVPPIKIQRYKLEKQLFELSVANMNANPNPLASLTSQAQFVPTPEMLALEKEIMGLEDDEEDDIFEVGAAPKVAKTPQQSKLKEGESVRCPERVLCERCWNLRNRSKAVSVSVTAEYFREVVAPIKELKTRPLIIKMVDLFDFHGSFIPHFRKYIGNNRVLIVASKFDLLPKGVHPERIRIWVANEARKFGIDPVGVALISKNGFGIRELADQLEFYREGGDVYIMGSANVGKSTFINMLIDIFKGPKDKKVTVSPVPGTTLNFLSLPIGSHSFLYDTPGIITSKQIYNYLAADELKKIMPKKQIRPSVYRIAPGTTLLLGGLARLDYLEGPPLAYFTLFASNEIYIHKTSIERADEVYQDHLGTILTPPFNADTLADWPGFGDGIVHSFSNDDGNWQKACTDIVFSGLGWFSVTMQGQAKVRTFYPPGCLVGQRSPLMPFESHLGVRPNPRFNMKPSSVLARPKYYDQL
jgi:ribosome biogenesis GTPase YqeH